MSVYRFPPMKGLEGFTAREQHRKIRSELSEAMNCEIRYRCGGRQDREERENYGMELLDIIHATETALRMEFDADEIEELRAKVIEKNAKRGYYGGNDEKVIA